MAVTSNNSEAEGQFARRPCFAGRVRKIFTVSRKVLRHNYFSTPYVYLFTYLLYACTEYIVLLLIRESEALPLDTLSTH